MAVPAVAARTTNWPLGPTRTDEGEPTAAVSDPTLIPFDEARTEAARSQRFLNWRNSLSTFSRDL